MTDIIDHKKLAISRLITQFKESTNLISYIKTLLIEADTLEQTFQDIINLRFLDNATGAQLDVLGVIVGQTRIFIDAEIFEYFGFAVNAQSQSFGDLNDPTVGGRFISVGEPITGIRILNDEEYRLFIRARIAKNSTRSTPDDIIRQIRSIFGSPLVLFEDGDTEYTVNIGKILSLNEKSILFDTDVIPKTAGVRVNYQTEFDGDDFFSFEGVFGGDGFGSIFNPDLGGKFGNLI